MTEFEAYPTDFARIDEFGIVVLTVPKAAHTSILNAFAETFRNPNETSKGAVKRWRADNPPTWPASYLSVGFYRDPLDRFRSCWQNKIATVDRCRTELAAIGCRPGMSLDRFSELVASTPDENLDKHLIPQHYKLLADDVLRVDHLIRFEELTSMWGVLRELIVAHCGRSLANLPKFNVSDPVRSGWSERAQQLVRDKYAVDYTICFDA